MGKIVLNERQLRDIIKESVYNILNEIGDTEKGQFALGAVKGRAAGRCAYQPKYQNVKSRNQQGWKMNDADDEAWENRMDINDLNKLNSMSNANKSGYNYGFNKGMHK